jgi:hypothetical protein
MFATINLINLIQQTPIFFVLISISILHRKIFQLRIQNKKKTLYIFINKEWSINQFIIIIFLLLFKFEILLTIKINNKTAEMK